MKLKVKRSICSLVCAILLCSSFTVNAADEQIKLSDKEYLVSLMDANSIFISNDKAVSGEVGSKVFLTYTVEEVTKNTTTTNGVIGTKDNTQDYPYVKDGKLCYSKKSQLFEVGYTYVFRFERTTSGFTYECAKMKGNEAININFANVAQNGDGEDYNYYGIWIDGDGGTGISALLNHVRCYDEKGNDLGIHFNRSTGTIQNEANALLDVHLQIDTNYSFKVEKSDTLAIGSKYPTNSDVVYMEYEVEDVTADKTTQQGVIIARNLSDVYPHAGDNGLLTFKALTQDEADKPLLRKGAKYFICFAKQPEGYTAIVQCTMNGQTETFSFPYTYGGYSKGHQYVALWFGEGGDNYFSASFKNFKCYDSAGNNLGVQMRDTDVQIELHGETEDYSKSKAVYYCEDNNGFIVLADDKSGSRQIAAEKADCSYKILNRDELYLSFKDGKEVYHYTTFAITDEENHKYKRMRNSTVTFVTGAETTKVEAEATNGYRVVQPENPTQEGNTFLGWYYSDGRAYDFDTVVTKDFTLYAKWQDSEGNEYLAVSQENTSGENLSMIVSIISSVVILSGCVAGCILITKRRKIANGRIK